MRKQIFTLVLLGLVCSVGNVWGDEFAASDISTSGTTKNHVTCTSTAGTSASANVCNDNADNYGSGTASMITGSANSNPNSNYIEIKAASGYKLVSPITIDGVIQNNSDKAICVVYWEGDYSGTEFSDWENVTFPNRKTICDNASTELTFTGTVRTIRLYKQLYINDDGYQTSSGTGKTQGGNTNLGVTNITASATLIGSDEIAPILISTSPADDATNVAVSGNIILTFDENVALVSDYEFSLKQGETTVKTWSAATTAATVSGKNITLAYTGLTALTNYSLEINNASKIVDTQTTPNAMSSITLPSFTTGAPTISASDASITATEIGVEATQDIVVNGSNLSGSTLTATLSPAVPGLSVTLVSSTITAGSISTTATLHYTKTENASGSTKLILSDGTTTKNVTITYFASVAEWVLQTISDETTWDFSTKVTGSIQYSGDNLTVEHVYANIAELEFADGFNATAIAFTGQYPFRANDKKFAQNGIIHIKPTVSGTLSVKFSDTGSKNPTGERYLNINGVNSQYYTQRTGSSNDTKTVSGIPVDAGDVEIKACYADGSDIAVCVYTLTFSPVTSYTLSLTAGKWVSFCPSIDVTIPANVVAYKGVIGGSDVVLTPIGQNTIKAGVGVILKASADGSYTFSSTTASAFADNSLLGTTVRKARNTSKVTYALYEDGEGVQKFTKYEGGYIPANKAYFELESQVSLAPSAFRIVDGEENATSIQNIEVLEKAVKFIENGQLLIRKDGVVYDMTGRIVK